MRARAREPLLKPQVEEEAESRWCRGASGDASMNMRCHTLWGLAPALVGAPAPLRGSAQSLREVGRVGVRGLQESARVARVARAQGSPAHLGTRGAR